MPIIPHSPSSHSNPCALPTNRPASPSPADRRPQSPYFRDAKILRLIAETLSRSSVWRSRQLGALLERAGQGKIFATRKYSRHWQSSSCLLSIILIPSVPVRAPCEQPASFAKASQPATATPIFSRRENLGVDSRNGKPFLCLAHPPTWGVAGRAGGNDSPVLAWI